MITSNHCVPYLPQDHRLPISHLFVDLSADTQVTGGTLIYFTKDVTPWYRNLLDTILVLREVFAFGELIFPTRRRLAIEYRNNYERRDKITEFLKGKASEELLIAILRRFNWIKQPARVNYEDFAIDEHWFELLVEISVKFFMDGKDDKRRRSDSSLTGRWLTGTTLISVADRTEFIWRSTGTTMPIPIAQIPRIAEVNIFKSVTDDEPTDPNYIDDMNKGYDGPTAEELDRMEAEDRAQKEAANNNTPSAALQKLTVWSLREGPYHKIKEEDFPLTLEKLYVLIDINASAIASSQVAITSMMNRVTATENKLNKLLRLNSWLLAAWIMTGIIVGALLVFNLKNFI